MSYTIEELRPLKKILFLDNKHVRISPFTLHHNVVFIDKFGEVNNCFEEIKKNPDLLFWCVWQLVENKHVFGNYQNFYKKVVETTSDLIGTTKKLYKLLLNTIQDGQPLIRNAQRQKDLQAIIEHQTDGDRINCYAKYYDTVASRYSYSLDQFYDLTLRQLHIILKTIGDSKYEELEVQATLQGKKLKERMKINDISEEEEKEQDEMALEMFKRLQEQHKERQKNA